VIAGREARIESGTLITYEDELETKLGLLDKIQIIEENLIFMNLS